MGPPNVGGSGPSSPAALRGSRTVPVDEPSAADRELVISSLLRDLEDGTVVIFAGAGVSISPPAALPNWLDLRDWTLAAVASRSSALAGPLTTLTGMDMLSAPGRKGMTPEV